MRVWLLCIDDKTYISTAVGKVRQLTRGEGATNIPAIPIIFFSGVGQLDWSSPQKPPFFFPSFQKRSTEARAAGSALDQGSGYRESRN